MSVEEIESVWEIEVRLESKSVLGTVLLLLGQLLGVLSLLTLGQSNHYISYEHKSGIPERITKSSSVEYLLFIFNIIYNNYTSLIMQ